MMLSFFREDFHSLVGPVVQIIIVALHGPMAGHAENDKHEGRDYCRHLVADIITKQLLQAHRNFVKRQSFDF